MIPKRIYLREADFDDLLTGERMVSCDEPFNDLNVEYTDLSQIWHNASEEPKEDMDILLISKNGKVNKVSKIDQTLYDWIKDNDGIDKWAYISDLLPKGGNE